MRGSLHSQIEGLYHRYAKGIGISRDWIKRCGVADTLIHADNSRAAYVAVWHRIYKFAAMNHHIKNVEQLTAEMVADWLDQQVKNGLAPDTIGQYCSAITKLQQALNKLNRGGTKCTTSVQK